MDFLLKNKKILIGILVFILAFIVYSMFFKGDAANQELISSSSRSISKNNSAISSEIIKALNQIESLDLDTTLFEDDVYRSLTDKSEPIAEEPVGKKNPFAPIDSSVATDDTVIEAASESSE